MAGRVGGQWLLRARDQRTLAGLVGLGLLVLAGRVLYGTWGSARLVEYSSAPSRTAAFQVDVNQADWPELILLPGIGETLARRIVEHRRLQGEFTDHEQLRQVRGIGPKKLERIRPYLKPIR